MLQLICEGRCNDPGSVAAYDAAAQRYREIRNRPTKAQTDETPPMLTSAGIARRLVHTPHQVTIARNPVRSARAVCTICHTAREW